VLLTFTEQQLASLLPAYLRLDSSLYIKAIGPSVAEHLPDIRVGMRCTDVFDFIHTDIEQFFDNTQGVKPIRLVSHCGSTHLFGAAVFDKTGCILAVRHVLSEESMNNGTLYLNDFGYADPVVLSTMLISLQRAMLEESQATAIELAHERERSASLLERTGRVAGYMGHDFNNLLSIIRLNADRLLRKFGHDEKISNLAQIIRETAARGSNITQSLMKLSQQQTDTLLPIIIDDLIRENDTFLNSVVGLGISFDIDLQAATCESVISYNGLLNCIINLLINAREAMPHGGRISLSTSIKHGLVTSKSDSGDTEPSAYIAICVADSGSGMSEALLSRAFEPLFSSKPKGTGLGLASVRDFAKEMGGDVWLESQVGEGTTVYLHLPLANPSAEAQTAPKFGQSADTPAIGTRHILLVEDEPYALEALAEMLEAEGYAVTPCASGEQAMQALEQQAYHLLLTDIVMPGQTGTEIARHANRGQPSIKTILMSGYVPDSASLEPGWMFIRKPMDSDELLRLVASAV
jgi:signal transduction histidine kinase